MSEMRAPECRLRQAAVCWLQNARTMQPPHATNSMKKPTTRQQRAAVPISPCKTPARMPSSTTCTHLQRLAQVKLHRRLLGGTHEVAHKAGGTKGQGIHVLCCHGVYQARLLDQQGGGGGWEYGVSDRAMGTGLHAGACGMMCRDLPARPPQAPPLFAEQQGQKTCGLWAQAALILLKTTDAFSNKSTRISKQRRC